MKKNRRIRLQCLCGEVVCGVRRANWHASNKCSPAVFISEHALFDYAHTPRGSVVSCRKCDYYSVHSSKTPLKPLDKILQHLPYCKHSKTMKFERSLANRPLCHYRFTPELWLETSRRTNLATIIASEICKSCGIKNECLAISSKTNASFGVWGGINFASKTTQNKEVLNA